MKNITAIATLPDGRSTAIETHFVAPDEYSLFLQQIACVHPDAAFVTHGLRGLVLEGSKYFNRDSEGNLAYGYEQHDLSREYRSVHWVTVESRKYRRPHIAGVLEWIPMSSEETLLVRVYVLKQFRRRGIAAALMVEAVRHMKEQGYSAALAFVPRFDHCAGTFLASQDFRLSLRGGDDPHLYVLNLESFAWLGWRDTIFGKT